MQTSQVMNQLTHDELVVVVVVAVDGVVNLQMKLPTAVVISSYYVLLLMLPFRCVKMKFMMMCVR